MIVFKDNSNNINESLTASVTSGPAVNVSALTLRLGPFNTVDGSPTVFSPPKTSAFQIEIGGLNLGIGQSITIQWTDSNDGGTDGMFGIKDLVLKWDVPTVTAGNYWDTNGTTAGVGGNGTWSTSGTTWSNEAGTDPPVAFDPTSEVIFGGSGGTVDIDGTISHESNIRFESDGYLIQGGSLDLTTGGDTPIISVVTAGDIAIINSVIEGYSGLSKAGAGILVLGGENTFAGELTISAGVLEVSADENLGDLTNAIIFGGGTLKTTATMTLNVDRAISGDGKLDIADGTTLTVDGTVNFTGLALSNSGTLVLNNEAESALGAVTISGNATVQGNGASLTGINATHTGTATIENDLNFGTGDRQVVVTNAAAVLALEGDLSGVRIVKTGAGTLEATGDNAGMTGGFQLGIAGTTPTNGGTLKIGHQNGLGTNAQFRFNYGTLHATTDLTGANAMANSLSIGGRAGAAAEFAGEDMEFTGTVGFFLPASTSGQLVLNTYNTTYLSGDRTTDTVLGSGGTLGSATGLTFGGTGRLVLNGNWGTNTRNVTLAQSITTEINHQFTGSITVGDGDATGGTTPTLQGSGNVTGNVTVNADGSLKVGQTGDTSGRSFTITGSLSNAGTLEFDIFGPGDADMLILAGDDTTTVSLTGTLIVNNADPFFADTPWADGEFWQLVDWGSVLEGNRNVDFDVITLPDIDGYTWINTIATDGRITLQAVPEPGRALLLLMGGGLWLLQRRRRKASDTAVV